MFFSKKYLESKEYLELKKLYDTLKLQVSALELELALYVKKLKASKGLKTGETSEETKDIYSEQLLPM